MSYTNLPAFLRNSSVFTLEEKEKLASLDVLPSEIEVDNFRMEPAIQELTNAFIGDDSTRDIHLQEKAKEYIAANDIISAWKVILL